VAARQLTIGLTLSLSGAYAAMGTQARAALQLFADEQNSAGGIAIGAHRFRVQIRCLDDRSDARVCAQQYQSLCFEDPADIVFGPYSSGLTRAAAPIAAAAGRLMINHGGAADSLYDGQPRLLVGVLSPASDYFAGLVQLVSQLKFWRKRVAMLCSPSPFGRAVSGGFEHGCAARPVHWRGVRLRVHHEAAHLRDQALMDFLLHLIRAHINVLVSASSFEQDLALVDAVIRANLNIPVLACVAAGVRQFVLRLGEAAEGIVGPSQWEATVDNRPEIGPAAPEFARRMQAAGVDHCDYPAAQIYAAGLLTATALQRCASLDQNRLREALADLRTSTLFGEFAIDRVSGRQIGHRVLLVQWHHGDKVIIHPDAHADAGALEFPSGWRLLLASLANLRLRRPRQDEQAQENNGDDRN
jgi:branched-chain amino acid transport system substrate-binding protein